MSLKVGDTVRYVSGKHGWGPANPKDVDGTIYDFIGGWITVRWPGGIENSYREEDLKIVDSMTENGKSIKLNKRMKMEMVKLKKEIRAAVVEYVDLVTRKIEAEEKPEKKLSEKAVEIISIATKAGYVGPITDMFGVLLGEDLKVAKFNRLKKDVMLVPLNKNYSSNYAVGEPCLVRTNGDDILYKKEGTIGNHISKEEGDTRFATKEEIADFFEYFPDGMMLAIFQNIPAEKAEKK